MFITNLVNLPTEEFLKKYFPKRLFRGLVKKSPENVVIRFITDEVSDFCKLQDIILSAQEHQQNFDLTKKTLLENNQIMSSIVKQENNYLIQFKEEFFTKHKDIKITQKSADNFLRTKGVWPTSDVVKYFYCLLKDETLKAK